MTSLQLLILFAAVMFVLALAWGTVITRWIRQAPVSSAAT